MNNVFRKKNLRFWAKNPLQYYKWKPNFFDERTIYKLRIRITTRVC